MLTTRQLTDYPLRLAASAAAAASLAFGGFSAPLAAQTSSIALDSRATYLHVNSDAAPNATPIALASVGLAPGKCVRLRTLGTFDNGPNGDTFTSMIGVFSSSATLLGPTLLNRVPGAIEAGVDVVTSPTWFGTQVTDIAEDFGINTSLVSEVTVMVPAGATHLFVSPADQLFSDNSDPNGDFKVELTVVGCWTNLGLGLAGANPAPALSGTGTLIGGAPMSLDLAGAKPDSTAALVVGFGQLNAPFKGGTLVPTVNLLITGLPTGASGALSLPATWPTGLPSGFSIYFQEWIADPTGPAGFTATNGLKATTP